MTMPRYKSHKVVEAAPICSYNNQKDPWVEVEIGDEVRTIVVPADFFARGTPTIGDYLVRYPDSDGYLSWSPKQPFEDGYTRE